jgi:hypothetical protein
MRPVPIPDESVPEGCKRYVISPPDGDLTNDQIRSVEAVAGIVDGAVHISVLVALEPGDLERMQAMQPGGDRETPYGPAMWLTMITLQIPPFLVEIADGQG